MTAGPRRAYPDIRRVQSLSRARLRGWTLTASPEALAAYLPAAAPVFAVGVALWPEAAELGITAFDSFGFTPARTRDVQAFSVGTLPEDREPLSFSLPGQASLEVFRTLSPIHQLAWLASRLSTELRAGLARAFPPDDTLREVRELADWRREEFFAAVLEEYGSRPSVTVLRPQRWSELLGAAARLGAPGDTEDGEAVGVARWEGADGVVRIWPLEGRSSNLVMLLMADGSRRRTLPREVPEALRPVARLLGEGYLGGALLGVLAATFGEDDGLAQVRRMAPGRRDAFVDFVALLHRKPETVARWQTALDGFALTDSLAYCEVAPGDSWLGEVISTTQGAIAAASIRLVAALRRGPGVIAPTALDVEAYARTRLPWNALVESVTARPDGRARVVLREPVRPTMVQFRSVVWVEEVPGTVLTDMTVAAFDLDFSSPLNRFPHAVAYADRDCTVHARHTNIHQGAICLGNINDPMTPAEVAARGGSSLARVADLVQMLRLCNLDSPHNGSREFNLRTPESVSEDNWRACATNGVWIPGLRRLDSDSRAHAADPPAPHRGRVELIPDGD